MSSIDAAAMKTSLIIEPAGAYRFAYTKVSQDTGEAVWRWPHEEPLQQTSRALEAKGQLLDVTA